VHDSRGIEIVNFTISLSLSAGTLMASAGTPYRLVPAHFYPCSSANPNPRINPTNPRPETPHSGRGGDRASHHLSTLAHTEGRQRYVTGRC